VFALGRTAGGIEGLLWVESGRTSKSALGQEQTYANVRMCVGR